MESGTETGGMAESPPDESLRLVADRSRRRVLEHLRYEATGRTTLDDLVDRLLSSGSVSVGDRRADRKTLALQLYHVHLPKLDDHGVVEFDPDSGTVQYAADERFEAFLDSIPGGVSVADP